MKKFADCVIPDAELAEYLKDKILTKPDYPSSVGPSEIPSDYAAVQARLNAMRSQDNEKTKKAYGLKGKK